MINTTELVMLHHTDATERFGLQLCVLSRKIELTAKYKGQPFSEIVNRQKRARLALPIFLNFRGDECFTEEHVQLLYKFAHAGSTTKELTEAYQTLTGIYPVTREDVLGLRVPVRASFLVSWADQRMTLPHTYTLSGVHPKFPELTKLTQGFAFTLVKNSRSHKKAVTNFQYRTTWHSAELVKIADIWELAPMVCAVQSTIAAPKLKSLCFSYLGWLKDFSEAYPNILSDNQQFLITKYHQYLHAKGVKEREAIKIAGIDEKFPRNYAKYSMSYEDFESYWVTTAEEDAEFTPKQRQHSRYKARQRLWFEEKVRIGHETGVTYRQSLENKRNGAAGTLNQELPKPLHQLAALEAFTHVNRVSRSSDLKWLKPSFYAPYGLTDTLQVAKNWAIAAMGYHCHLEDTQISGSSWKERISAVRFILDYVCCYIPLWIKQNPQACVRQPLRICEFERVIFWRRMTNRSAAFDGLLEETDLIDDEGEDVNEDSAEQNLSDLPITMREMYLRHRSKANSGQFVRAIYEFFEYVIAHQAELSTNGMELLDRDYRNPVNRRIDSPGSGGRGKTDKIVLPVESTLIARSYILALNDIGINIREKILLGELHPNHAKELADCEWIDLKALGFDTKLKIGNPSSDKQFIEIPLKRIINAFSWKLGYYNTPNGKKLLTQLPWMSNIRMLMVSMFAGLRLQNSQWLDVFSFDEIHKSMQYDCLGQTILHVNTDKNGSDRPVTLDLKVMESLIDERRHQLDICTKPLSWVYYEGDKKNKDLYGKIYPLFRSTWTTKSMPFTDGTYSRVWTLILRGIEETYNNFVPLEQQHSFLEKNANGEIVAVHTPHALRATWITHMRIYGHLEYEIIGLQVAHGKPYISQYYVSLPFKETLSAINKSGEIVLQTAYARLTGIAHPPSSPESALVKAWLADPVATAKNQSAVSVISNLLETEDLEKNLIATTAVNKVCFQKNCVCLRNGQCPKMLLEFTMTPRVCGLCPYAVFGIDHLPSIHIIIRELTNEADAYIEKIRRIKATDPQSLDLTENNRLLTLATMERAGYIQASAILTQALNDESPEAGEYISRYRDLIKFKTLDVDLQNPLQRIAARLIDSVSCAEFTAKHYPIILHKRARMPSLDELVFAEPEDLDLYMGQISSIMKLGNVSFDDISKRLADPKQIKNNANIQRTTIQA